MDGFDPRVRWLLAAPIYGVAYALAAFVFWRMAKRRGMATDGVARVMAAGLLGGLAGANLVQLLATGLPGKTIEGGIVGGWLAVIWMKRRLGITRPTGDLFALAIPAGEAVGRIACFVGGCCYGKAAGVAWAVHDHGALRHPAQLYLSLAAAVCFLALLAIERMRFLPENGLFYLGGALFCVDRFIVEFFREGSAMPLGITFAQAACIAGLAFFGWKLATLVHPRAPKPSRVTACP
ncbi:MAG TPA: prolipoprotein diacylglyceryl transferase family protein [Candidatus Cybelea sp.]|nr:prolipoprotein diacylglyceryl transferase family protein [Candidatus Cybelea sp.]